MSDTEAETDVGTDAGGGGAGVSRRGLLIAGGAAAGAAWIAPQIVSLPAASAATFPPGDVVAVGALGTIVASADAVTWVLVTSPTSVDLEDVTWGSGFGLYAAVGRDGTVLISPDGRNWEVRPSGTTNNLWSVIYVPFCNRFVAVGSFGTIVTSADGVNWSLAVADLSLDELRGVAASGTAIVAVGSDGALVTSTDGINYTVQTSLASGTLEDVEFAPDLLPQQFLAVGAGGSAWTSIDDGLSWTAQSTGSTVPYQFAVWNALAGAYVVVADDASEGGARYDGTTWTPDNGFPPNLFSITYSFPLAVFVAVGVVGIIATSSNGIVWSPQSSPTSEWLRGVAAKVF